MFGANWASREGEGTAAARSLIALTSRARAAETGANFPRIWSQTSGSSGGGNEQLKESAGRVERSEAGAAPSTRLEEGRRPVAALSTRPAERHSLARFVSACHSLHVTIFAAAAALLFARGALVGAAWPPCKTSRDGGSGAKVVWRRLLPQARPPARPPAHRPAAERAPPPPVCQRHMLKAWPT